MSSTENRRPRILVFAGPNGSGKSTVTKGVPLVGIYVNADEIKRQSGCSDLEAAQEAELIRSALIDRSMDFDVVDDPPPLVHHMGHIGKIIVQQHDVGRLTGRVASGGHDVPAEKVRSRYARSLKNLSKLVRIADMTRVVDNSGTEPNLICEVRGQTVTVWADKSWSKNEILALLSQ